MARTRSVPAEVAEDNDVRHPDDWDPTTWEPPLDPPDRLKEVRADVFYGVGFFTAGVAITVAGYGGTGSAGPLVVFCTPLAWGLYLIGRAAYYEGRVG